MWEVEIWFSGDLGESGLCCSKRLSESDSCMGDLVFIEKQSLPLGPSPFIISLDLGLSIKISSWNYRKVCSWLTPYLIQTNPSNLIPFVWRIHTVRPTVPADCYNIPCLTREFLSTSTILYTMVFHSFHSLRRKRSREVKRNQDSPTLPKTPAAELPPSLIAAMENLDNNSNSPRNHQPLINVAPNLRADVVSGFFNLQPPLPPPNMQTTRLEDTVRRLFSEDHFSHILADKALFQRFSAFLNKYQPQYVPALIRHLDMLKAAKAIEYANAITRRMVWTDRLESHRHSGLAAATMVRLNLITRTIDTEPL